MVKFFVKALTLISVAIGIGLPSIAQTLSSRHALTLGDKPKYEKDFKNLDYVNPGAPKGGQIRRHSIGSFDSFNPFIIKGTPAAGIGLVFETLTTTTEDDALSDYGLIAETITTPSDLSWVEFKLRQNARFHDGTPINPEDVIYSFKTLTKQGRPHYRYYYSNVKKAEKTGPKTVRFHFKGKRNRELPQIMGQLPVISQKWWSQRNFSSTTLEIPLGSGPYKIKNFEPGRHITYERKKDYWGKNLPLNRGRYNFDEVRFDYYKDQSVAMEAFKAGEYDFRSENSSKRWAKDYQFPARRAKKVIVSEQSHTNPAGMQAFVYNLRRPKFQDKLLREALSYAFDFEWSNKNLFYGQYKRTRSFFQNSELAATGLPSPEELEILTPLRDYIDPRVFHQSYAPPITSGDGRVRGNLRIAQRLLKKAGWKIENTKLINPKTGQPLEIEFLLVSPDFERVVLPFIQNLKRLGVMGKIRTVDPSQYQNRIRDFDFDVIIFTFGQSNSPGNEQRDLWSSNSATRKGSYNISGIRNLAVDALVDQIISAPNRKRLVTASRALDRVLQWSHIVIPQWHISAFRLARWDKFGIPPKPPAHGPGFWSWWIDPEKEASLRSVRK